MKMNNKQCGAGLWRLVGSLATVVVGLLVAASAFGVPSVGLNQPLSPVAAGVHGAAYPAPVRRVIQNPTDYANFFGGVPPSTPTIDWKKQDVIAVSMGNEPTGGYNIGISHV